MRYFTLDGAAVDSREMLHEMLRAGLALPDWYGGNLDALYDCLTDVDGVVMDVVDADTLRETLGDYAGQFFRVLRDAAAENPRFRIIF